VRPPELTLPESVELTMLRRDPLVMVLPIRHPLAQKDSIAIMI
jgi:DNA-binding transcriptional LysR family regulator